MKPKVSIIVPIYNMERYLKRCLNSLVNQSLTELEIITVNDGSKDNSLGILREYASRDSRFKVINQTNQGVSSARNAGLDRAKGEFIGFVDPDDWIDERMYQTLYEQAKSIEAEIAMCSYVREFGTHSKDKEFDLPKRRIFDKEEVRELLRRLVGPINEEVGNPEMLDAWGTVWSKIYRSDLIQEYRVRFVDLKEIGTNEDSLFNLNVLYLAQKLIFMNQPLYHYWRENDQSITSNYKPNLVNQFFKLYEKMGSFIEEKKLNQTYEKALRNRICMNTLGLGFNSISDGKETSHFTKLKRIGELLNDERIIESFKEFELNQFSISWRLFYFCAKSRFSIGYYVLLQMAQYMRRKKS